MRRVLWVLVVVLGGLCWAEEFTIFRKKCKNSFCTLHQYCSEFDNQCKNCSNICDTTSRNFDEHVCTRDCQDYMHDKRYVLRGEQATNEELRVIVNKLHSMVTVSLTLTCFVLLVLIAIIGIQIWSWKKKNHVTLSSLRSKFFGSPSDKTKQNGSSNVQTEATGKTDLRIEMPVPPRSDIHSENSPNTVTTSISRRPAEDSPLDYAYDNPAMSTTPSPHSTNKPHESTF